MKLPNLFKLSLKETPTDAPRGGRRESDEAAFQDQRKYRLTASLLPHWCSGILADSVDGRQDQVRMTILKRMHAGDGIYQPAYNPFSAPAMEWGRNNEKHALSAYMEVTRAQVSLGSVRNRAVLLQREQPQNQRQRVGELVAGLVAEPVAWNELLGATPDGFVRDPNEQGSEQEGLLEIKCPADAQMHNPDVELRIEGRDKKVTVLLQAWEQLQVITSAKYVDICRYKREGVGLEQPQTDAQGTAQRDPNTGNYIMRRSDEYIWLGRLYRNDRYMKEIQDLLQPEFRVFQRGVQAMRADTSQAVAGQEERPILKRNGAEFRLTQEEAIMPKERRESVREKLGEWAFYHLKYRDSGDRMKWKSEYEIRMNAMPNTPLTDAEKRRAQRRTVFRSDADLDPMQKALLAGRMSQLVRRYDVHSGEMYGWDARRQQHIRLGSGAGVARRV